MRRVAFDADAEPRPGDTVQLPDRSAHYVVTVLRCPLGQELELFDGEGNAWIGTLTATDPATVEITKRLDRSGSESPCEITLYQTVPKRDRFEWLIEKTTELGVVRIVPLESARSVVRIPSARIDKKLKRWRKIATSAARQSQRAVVPEISPPQSLANALSDAPERTHAFLHPEADHRLGDVVADVRSVGLWIGPEGGFTADEVALLSETARAVSVGPRILRSETAGIVSVALAQEHTGGLAR